MLVNDESLGSGAMESNSRYYQRRAGEELRAAARAVTPEARARRRALAESFASKAAECHAHRPMAGEQAGSQPSFESLAPQAMTAAA
jgi:hypothetical protein